MMAKSTKAKRARDVVGSAADNQYLQRLMEDEDLRDSVRDAFEAARDAYVDRGTVTRWIKQPDMVARVEEVKREISAELEPEADAAEEARRGLARLIPIAEEVVEAALKGEDYNGRPVTAQQHQNALRTIDLAHKLQPRETGGATGAPSLAELIARADESRS